MFRGSAGTFPLLGSAIGLTVLVLVLLSIGGPTPAAAQTDGPPVSLVEAIVDQVLRLFLNL